MQRSGELFSPCIISKNMFGVSVSAVEVIAKMQSNGESTSAPDEENEAVWTTLIFRGTSIEF
jgi:hypothetical protein